MTGVTGDLLPPCRCGDPDRFHESSCARSRARRYVAEALADNEYLRGDGCASTRNYLKGWIGSCFRRGESAAGRAAAMTNDEIAEVDAAIDAFLTED